LEMRGYLLITVAALVALAPTAQAAERVTLRNGFEIRCDHHAQVEGRVRLYLGADEDNYIEFEPQEIVEVQQLPDPPPALPPTFAERAPAASPATGTQANADARLNPGDLH
jgi:hypothetical protein